MKSKTLLVIALAYICFGVSASAQEKSLLEIWPQSLNAFTDGAISQLSVFPQVDTAGVETMHRVEFGLSGDTLQPGAEFKLFFPSGFGLGEVDSCLYADDDPGNSEYTISSVTRDGQELRLTLSSAGQAPVSGSKITLKLFGMKNATTASSYQVALAISSPSGELIASPTWSSSFVIRADKLASLVLFPEGIQQIRAGTILQFTTETKDRYGNPVSAQPIQWSVIGVPSPTGTIAGGVFQARHTGASRVVATYQTFSDTSSLVYVLPGTFARFAVSGAPDSVVAGEVWTDGTNDVVVTAYDLFGNVAYDYQGDIYFTSSDILASLPFTRLSPYSFETADQGRHVFRGSSFRLFNAGRQSLDLMQDDSVMHSITGINVLAADVDHFTLTAPDTVMAGHTFTIQVGNAVDQWNNAVTATATLGLGSGTGAAPSGSLPALPPFLAANGSGSTTAMLVRMGLDTLTCDIEGVVQRHAVVILADSLSRFAFELSPVQTPSKPFTGTARLTALDRFENTVDWFSASRDPVTISCSGSGSVTNRRIDGAAAFVNGVCDLRPIGTGYAGTDLYVTFTATSTTGRKGTSPLIGFSFLRITTGALVEPTRYVGEKYTFRLTISDFGNQPGVIDSIDLFIDNAIASGVSVDRVFPDTIPSLSSREYVLTGDVPNKPGESVSFAAKLLGRIGADVVSDSVGDLGDLAILPLEGVGVVTSSLKPMQVSRGRSYSFSLKVFNNSGDDLRLTANSRLSLGQVAQYTLENPTVVSAHGGVTELRFTKADVPVQSPDLISNVTVRLVGTLGTSAFDQTLDAGSSVITQSQPSLSIKQGTLVPTTVFRGREVAFELDLENSGTATLAVESDAVALSLFAGGRKLSAVVNSAPLQVANGVKHLEFEPLFVPADFPTGVDSLALEVAGTANDYAYQYRMQLPGYLLTVPSGAAVQVVEISLIARNAPYVDVGQSFAIEATVRNQGDEPLRQIVVRLTGEGGSTFNDSILIEQLPIESDTVVEFPITAAMTPSASDLFSVRITGATGVNSSLPAQIMTPLSNAQVVVIQTPANLRLISSISSPVEAQDGVVKPASSFFLAASVLNNGQSGVGEGEVTLQILDGEFSSASPLIQTFAIGENIEWNLTAPAANDTGVFEIAVTTTPEDNNTGIASKVIDRIDTITVIAAEQQVSLGVDFTTLAPVLLAAGGTYEMLRLDFDVVGKSERPYLKFIDLALRDRAGKDIDPSVLIASASLRYNFTTELAAVAEGNHLRFVLGENSGVPQLAVVKLTLQADPTKLDAVLYLDSNSFAAEYITPGGAKAVPIAARFASRLVITQDLTLVPTTLEQSFFSYPNPFSPLQGEATIVYSLSVAKEATLRIYTLTGDEVLSRTLPAPVAVGEPVTVTWDGKNSDGQVVLNGVYIAVLTVEGLPEVRTKIAVVK